MEEKWLMLSFVLGSKNSTWALEFTHLLSPLSSQQFLWSTWMLLLLANTLDLRERHGVHANFDTLWNNNYQLRKERQMAKYTKERPRESFKSDHQYVLYFFKRMLYEWEDELGFAQYQECLVGDMLCVSSLLNHRYLQQNRLFGPQWFALL